MLPPTSKPPSLLIAIVALFVAYTSPALADSSAECAKAYEEVQTLRRQGKLLAARKQALFCASDVCPRVLVKDCVAWATDLERATPTLSFDAFDPRGATLTDVKIFVDGVLVEEQLSGRPVSLDPGSHTLAFEHGALPRVEQRLLVHETDRARRFVVRFRERPEHERPVPVMTWIFGGVSLASLAGGLYFALSGLGQKSDLDDARCAPRCAPADVDAMSRNLAIGDLLLGVSLVSGGAAAVSFVLRPTVEVGSSGNARAWVPTLRGTF